MEDFWKANANAGWSLVEAYIKLKEGIIKDEE